MKKKKTVKKLKPTAHKLGHHPDLRTKAGRAWKARREARLVRAEARNARIKQAAYEKEVKAAVTGSWVDLRDHPANKALRETYAEMDKPAYLTNVPTDMDKLKSTGMYWELFPNGHEDMNPCGGKALNLQHEGHGVYKVDPQMPYLSGTTGNEPQYQQDGTQRVSPFMENRADLAGSICGAYSRVMV